MRFGLIANLNRPGSHDAINRLLGWARETGNDVVLCHELEGIAPDLPHAHRDQLARQVEVMVTMGGDGTLLASSRAVADSGTPLLGINVGSLGFLTQLTPQQMPEALNKIVSGDYQIEKRMLLMAEVDGAEQPEYPYALNDIVVDNGPVSRLIDIDLFVNDQEVVTYRADGLVISTPTGSTAYNLAVGGPVMNPTVQAMIAAPISSFSLATRPLILSPSDHLTVRIRSPHGVGGLTLDGQVMVELKDTDAVHIRRADFNARFIVFPESNFYRLLTSKLKWGVSPSA